ncbi:N,N-dimethylformamidase beta subunit family domain-containing protein [Streptomyces niveus]|uniref:N,N-dimethylformamidase beta subunit family domain-containing protein n=1 Tax=Streptomyces niveus TaxID=193462 RepID=UPI003718B6F2
MGRPSRPARPVPPRRHRTPSGPRVTGINGYPSQPSVRAGETVRLHIATSAPHFNIDFYRWGSKPRHAGRVGWLGCDAAPGRYDRDWHWPAYDFRVPRDWPSGVYVAVLSTDPVSGTPLMDTREARMLLVVTPPAPSGRKVLYKIPIFTYHAYNTAGGGSLYSASHVTLRRPGGGVGGPVKGLPDPYDATSPRQTFAHWDAPFISWMEGSGIEVDYCTDLDIDEGRFLNDGYRLLVSAGHDEYWSTGARRNVTAFRDGGGNIANFGANTCWWRVKVAPTGISGLECDKFPPGAPEGTDPDGSYGCPDHWWESEPENTLLGVSYRNGGGHWDGPRASLGFTVADADHWVFSDTGLKTGDTFGRDGALIGYECDGAAYQIDRDGRPRPTGQDGTPKDFEILGLAQLPADWHFAAREPTDSPRAATLGLRASSASGGAVFTAATTDWARLLATDLHVATITRNVLTRLV